MVEGICSTISMVTSLRFLESMSLLFVLSVEVLMVLFGKQKKNKNPFFNFAQLICFVFLHFSVKGSLWYCLLRGFVFFIFVYIFLNQFVVFAFLCKG